MAGEFGRSKPIENVWAIMKDRLYENGEPKSMIGLKRMVTSFFQDFSLEVCRKLLAGMPRRFEQLRAAQFLHIAH